METPWSLAGYILLNEWVKRKCRPGKYGLSTLKIQVLYALTVQMFLDENNL